MGMSHVRGALLAVAASMLALASPARAMPTGFMAQDEADALCAIVMSYSLGERSDQDITADERQGLASIILYFVGKIKGRHPTLKISELLAPAYVESKEEQLAAAAPRCLQEALEVGSDLVTAGHILKEADRHSVPMF